MAFFPVATATQGGLLAVTPNGQVVRMGDYAPDPRGGQTRSAYFNYTPDRWGEHPDAYKLYQGAQGRLFRSYNPGIHGGSAQSNFVRGYNPDGSIGKPFYAPGEPEDQGPREFGWEWAPASDRAVWNKAIQQLAAGKARNAGLTGNIHVAQTQGINGWKGLPEGVTRTPGPYMGPTIPKIGAAIPRVAAPAVAPVTPTSALAAATTPVFTPAQLQYSFQAPSSPPDFLHLTNYNQVRQVGASPPNGLV